MRIFVVSRLYIERMNNLNPQWYIGKHIISIFSKGDVSPLPNRCNILKLNFDDVTENNNEDGVIFFNENHAKEIYNFISKISAEAKKDFYVHCDAGVSRSGAVGMILNEWFNKFLTVNRMDYEDFLMNNNHILSNPLVVRILKNELFGQPFV